MSAYSWENTAQKCKGCNTEVMPHSLDPLKGKKYLVEYDCYCGHSWTRECYQGDKDDEQTCSSCFEEVYPGMQEEFDVGNKEIPHPQHLCGKCKKLGRFCGKYS